MQRAAVVWLVVVVVLLAAAVVGWQLFRTPVPAELRPVTVRLKWLHQAQFAGMYMAQEQGFYRAAGLEVTLQEAEQGAAKSAMQEVADGDVQFAIVSPFQLLISIDEGLPIAAVAAIFQDSPIAYASLRDRAITEPTDLPGHTLGVPALLSFNQLVINGVLELQGLDPATVEKKKIGFNSVASLEDGAADVVSLYRTNDLYRLDQLGIEYNLLLPEQYGLSAYDDLLVVSDESAAAHPELVRSFLGATIKGWEYALARPDEAAMVSLGNATAAQYQDLAYQRFILDQSAPLIRPTGGAPVGAMSFVRWQRLLNLMQDAGLLGRQFTTQDVYTTEFLP